MKEEGWRGVRSTAPWIRCGNGGSGRRRRSRARGSGTASGSACTCARAEGTGSEDLRAREASKSSSSFSCADTANGEQQHGPEAHPGEPAARLGVVLHGRRRLWRREERRDEI